SAFGFHDFGGGAILADTADRVAILHELPHRIGAEHSPARRALWHCLHHLADHAFELSWIDLAHGGDARCNVDLGVEITVGEHLVARGVVARHRHPLARALDVHLVLHAL